MPYRCSHCERRFDVPYRRHEHEMRCLAEQHMAVSAPPRMALARHPRAAPFDGARRLFAPPRGNGLAVGKYRYLYGRVEYFILLVAAAMLQVEDATTRDEILAHTEASMDRAYDQDPHRIKCARSASEGRTKFNKVASHYFQSRNGFIVGFSRHGWDAVEEVVARGMLPPLQSDLRRALTPPLRRITVAAGSLPDELEPQRDEMVDGGPDHEPVFAGDAVHDAVSESSRTSRLDVDGDMGRHTARSGNSNNTFAGSNSHRTSAPAEGSHSQARALARDLRVQTRLLEMGFKDETANAQAIQEARRVGTRSVEDVVQFAATMLL